MEEYVKEMEDLASKKISEYTKLLERIKLFKYRA
jgi:hypothetical protein